VPHERARAALERELEAEEWIVDGNFLDSGDSRFERVDTVVWLDPPRLLCIWRALRRRVRDRGRERPDLPVGAYEGFDWEFLRWIWRYDETDRAVVLDLLRGIEQEHDLWHLRTTDGAVERILGDG
jgi:adenylate kinase family enzyme